MSEVSSSIWIYYHVNKREWRGRRREEYDKRSHCHARGWWRARRHPRPPPQPAGRFTVRLFNFPEMGLWQLCHTDDKSGGPVVSHRARLVFGSSPSPYLHLHAPSGVKHFLQINGSPSLLKWCAEKCEGGLGSLGLMAEKDKTNNWELFFVLPALIIMGLFIMWASSMMLIRCGDTEVVGRV